MSVLTQRIKYVSSLIFRLTRHKKTEEHGTFSHKLHSAKAARVDHPHTQV